MAALEDRILGEKSQYYCSSDEEADVARAKDDEDSEEEDSGGGSGGEKSGIRESSSTSSGLGAAASDPCDVAPNLSARWRGGVATNTGPKGVIKDWQRYKQLEVEKREEQEAERLNLMRKLCLTCAPGEPPSVKDKKGGEEKQKKKSTEGIDDDDIDRLLEDDGFFDAYLKQRMAEMASRYERLPMFGELVEIMSGPDFLKAVDEEHKDVTVFIHLYEPDNPACATLNSCLRSLAFDYAKGFKFCTLDVRVVNMTEMFQSQGVPALLVFRGGNMVGNFVRLRDEFPTDDFRSCDVAKFLVEHGHLPDPSLVPKIMKSSATNASPKKKESKQARFRIGRFHGRRDFDDDDDDDDDD